MIKYAIFDMDGLMIDTERLAQKSFYEYVGPKLGVQFEPGELLGFIGKNREALNKWWDENIKAKYDIEEGWNEASAMSYEYQVAQIMQHGLKPKKGLIELLEWFKAHNIPCGVATSTDYEKVDLRLGEKGANVLGYFKTVTGGNQVKKSKPDPEAFFTAMESLGFSDPSEGVVFEDSILGTKAGVDGGFNVIAVPDLVPLNQPHIEQCLAKVESLDQAIEILEGKIVEE